MLGFKEGEGRGVLYALPDLSVFKHSCRDGANSQVCYVNMCGKFGGAQLDALLIITSASWRAQCKCSFSGESKAIYQRIVCAIPPNRIDVCTSLCVVVA